MSDKKYNLYWFSGSGNTLDIAMCIHNTLIEHNQKAELIPIEKSNPENINPESVIGLIVPVAMQGTYPLVWDFVNGLPQVDGTECFLVDTLGAYSGGIVGPIKRIVKKKGFKPLLASEILMPNNFSRKNVDTQKDNLRLEKSREKAKNVTMKLLNNEGSWFDIPLYSRLVSLLSKSKKLWKVVKDAKPIIFDPERCVKCGTCVKLCPVNNLTMTEENNTPKAGDSCILCQRCKTFCPKGAIKLGEKDGLNYRNSNITTKIFFENLNIG